MNPWAFIAIALGVVIIIIGIKGSQHDIASALTGKTTAGSTAATTAANTQSQTAGTNTGFAGVTAV